MMTHKKDNFIALNEYVVDLSESFFLKNLVHESNNFLSPISGFTEILLMEDSVDPNHQSYLSEITTAVQRHVEFNQQLLMLSGKLVPTKEVVSSDEFIALIKTRKFEVNNQLNGIVSFETNRTWLLNVVEAFCGFADSLQQSITPILLSEDNKFFKISTKFSSQPGAIDQSQFFQPFYTSRKLSSEKGLGLSWLPLFMKSMNGLIQLELGALGDLELNLFFVKKDQT